MKVNNGNHQSALSEINITPLVDVILVLLIIFMVTAPLLSQGLDVNLPVAESHALARTEQDVILTINRQGGMFLQNDATPYTWENLEKKLSVVFERREKKENFIKADEGVNYGSVVMAVSLIKKAGIERVGLVTL